MAKVCLGATWLRKRISRETFVPFVRIVNSACAFRAEAADWKRFG
jgi:hypothetical protein